MDLLAELRERLPVGPAFLFLGQGYLAAEGALQELLRLGHIKFGGAATSEPDEPSLRDLFAWARSTNHDDLRAWLRIQFDRLAPPESLQVIASYHWNGVYTSSIDLAVARAFRNEWREVQPVLCLDDHPLDPRNPARLHLTRLCGVVDRTEGDKCVPLTGQALRARLRIADGLADRLRDLLTPRGVLLIDGYHPADDWYDLNHLLPVLERLVPGQAHFFSAHPDLSLNDDIRSLETAGIVALHSESLASVLLNLEYGGHLHLGEHFEGGLGTHYLRCKGKVIAIPKEVWNSITLTARVLDEALVAPVPQLAPEARYRAFRDFVAGATGATFWQGFAHGFAFKRDFEDELERRVLGRASQQQLQHHPIIVHGQTGTGKTIALGALGHRLRKNTPYPVLFVERNAVPDTDAIDAFCLYLEEQGAPATVILWDGMLSNVNEYFGLQQALIGRGRKAVVVGTSYALKQDDGKARELRTRFAVPAELGAQPDGTSERERFCEFLRGIDPSLGGLGDLVRRSDSTFLVALYRLLPEARPQLYQGLVQEVVQVQKQILDLLAQMQAEAVTSEADGSPSVLAAALFKAGLAARYPDRLAETTAIAGEDIDQVEELIGLVMVPGKFNLAVPLDLLLRIVDPAWAADVPRLLERHDLFRWPEDVAGRLLVSARNAEEARIFIHSRFADPRAEVDFACRLIRGVRADGSDRGEADFAIKLIQSMGPSGRESKRYERYLRDLARSLTDVRLNYGLISPRLMLQEANLLREWVKNYGGTHGTQEECKDALEEAESVLLEALETEEAVSNKQLASALRTEHADTRATGMRQFRTSDASALHTEYNAVLDSVKRAMATVPENYHALDILSWCTFQCVLPQGGTELSPEQTDTLANLASLLDSVNPADLPFESKELYNRRRMELAHFLRDNKLSAEAFAALEAMGSTAGFYLQAVQISGPRISEGLLDADRIEQCYLAQQYLEKHRRQFERDARCLSYLLKVWWVANTSHRIFFQDPAPPERQTLALDTEKWRYVTELIGAIMQADPILYQDNAFLHYIRGVALFHLGSISESAQVFRMLRALNVGGGRRVQRHYLLSNEGGEPRALLAEVNDDGSHRREGRAWVPDIQYECRFLPDDFRGRVIRHRDVLENCHIAFNFFGPMLEPSALHHGR